MSRGEGQGSDATQKQTTGIGVDYWLMWVGQTISMIGDQFGAMALSILILQRTGSATAMSVNVILNMVPMLLIGPVAGLVLDRVNRKRVLVTADVCRGLLTLGLGWLIYAGRFTILHAYGWGVIVSVFRAFYDPGTMAIVPALVPPDRLQRANALQVSGRNVAMIAGPALAGVAVAEFGPWFALVANAVSFGVSALLISYARPRFEERRIPAGRPKLSELKEGFGFFRSLPLASVLLGLTIMVNACSQPSGIAMNVHILKTLGGDPTFLGSLFSVSAAASLISSSIIATRKRWPHLGRMAAIAVAGLGLSYILSGFAPWLWLIPVSMGISGAMGPLMQIPINTLYQDITPPDMRGRVFALRTALSRILSPVSFALAGVLLDTLGSRIVLALLGVILCIAALAAGARRELRDV
ncbi:MAG: MFS transporter [Bacillota bacterium]